MESTAITFDQLPHLVGSPSEKLDRVLELLETVGLPNPFNLHKPKRRIVYAKEAGKEAHLLHSEGVLPDTPQDIINGFECQRHPNSRVRHWCGHISLSYSPKDADRMTDEFMVKLALEYMEKMGTSRSLGIHRGVLSGA